MTAQQGQGSDWLQTFLPLGCLHDGEWEPRGGGVLLLDRPVIWLVTARAALEGLGDRPLHTWVPREQGGAFLDLTASQRQAGIDWIHHPTGLSATLFPTDDSFRIRAFTEAQCTRVRKLTPLQPVATIGCLYGPDIEQQPQPTKAVLDGIISSVNAQTGTIYSTAAMLPNNAGAPLLLASPYGGAVTLAGVLLGDAMAAAGDPRALPVRLGRAICVDAALELVRGKQAEAQRRGVSERAQAPNGDDAGGNP